MTTIQEHVVGASEVNFEIAKQFLGMANVTLGFSIAQLIAFGLTAAAASSDPKNGLTFQIQNHPKVSVGATILGSTLYALVLLYCQVSAHDILADLAMKSKALRSLEAFDVARMVAMVLGGFAATALVWSVAYPTQFWNFINRLFGLPRSNEEEPASSSQA
jgi:hypothetical protein